MIDVELDVFNEVYVPYYYCDARYLILYGSAASGKSFFFGQKIVLRMMEETGLRFLLVRKVGRTIRNSQFKLLKDIINMWGLTEYFDIKENDMQITCNMTGSECISSGMDDPEKLKSIAGITGIWAEEATELEVEDFTQLDLRLRGVTDCYQQIMISFNPVSNKNWVYKYFFTNPPENCVTLHTTYKDNRFLDKKYIQTLEELETKNPAYFKIYALGEWGTMGDVIFMPFKSLETFPTPEETIYGLDFGFVHPMSLYRIDLRDGEIFLTEIVYESQLTKAKLIERMKQLVVTNEPETPIGPLVSPMDTIFADSAEPASILEIKDAGFDCRPCWKYNGSVRDGINYIKGIHHLIYTRAGNVGLNSEVIDYTWKKDADGHPTEDPVKVGDDAIKSVIYGIYTYLRNRKDIKMGFVK